MCLKLGIITKLKLLLTDRDKGKENINKSNHYIPDL